MIVFRLSGEHPELPVAEISALYEAHGKKADVASRDATHLLVDSDLDENVLMRLAFTHEFYPVHRLAKPDSLDDVILGLGLKKPDSFCIRCLGFSNNAKEEKRVGGIIYENLHWRVNLKEPELTVHVIKIKGEVAICLRKYETDDTNKRDPNDRPFFHPLALNPKLARLFLNLARLKEGDRVLDPFCGSGSVLIEADLMGLTAIGTDRDREMLWGCAKNLEFYGLKAETGEGDATDIHLKDLDAIVTDPPYARASKMFKKGLEDLYDKFLQSSFVALKQGGFMVLAVPHASTLAYARVGFELVADYELYVHKSLTRRIYILKKPK
jgi:tRNA (guanine10-N2)-dimethyltransferase